MKKLKGYIFGRPFLNERVPQHIQNIINKDYCIKNKYNFLLSGTEYASKESSFILFEILEDIDLYDGIVFYSLLQMPVNQKKRYSLYEKCIKKKKEIHFACENLNIKNKAHIEKIETIFRLQYQKFKSQENKKKLGKEKYYANFRHKKTSRNYIERITNQKIKCMKIAKKYDYNYWDGDRKYGYGGYKYIPGYHEYLAKNLVKDYQLDKNSRVLDIGCGKGFLMYEIKKITGSKFIYGVDNSSYAIKKAKKEVKKNIFKHDARKKIKYNDNSFDLVISINTFHNFKLPEVSLALNEMERLGKNKYMCVESFTNESEQFGAQCWALTAETIIDKKSWKWVFKISGYSGEYEFIYFN